MWVSIFYLKLLGKYKAPLLGKDERTSTDKKRERRKKKHLQHKKRITKESNLKEMENRGFKPNQKKESAMKELKRLTSSGHQIKEVRIKYYEMSMYINTMRYSGLENIIIFCYNVIDFFLFLLYRV